MTIYGPAALALAALVAQQSPLLTITQKHQVVQLLNGTIPATAAGYTVAVRATKILCRMSDVDLTSRSCTLTFGKRSVSLAGREANELFATMGEAGIPSQGAAGTIYESAMSLACTIDFTQLRARAGGGATCTHT